MTKEVAFAAVKLGMKNTNTSGLLFYGGEPLLERQLIYDTVDYAKRTKKKKDAGHTFFYKMTTNGMLLDEEFLKFSKEANLTIGFSHDGPAQDDCRLLPDGSGTYTMLKDKIPLLLKYQPYAVGMSVVDPTTVHKMAAIVEFLYEKGFKYITLSLNYSTDAPWTNQHLSIIESEYKKLAEMYIRLTRAEEKFYFSPFDMKILSHLKGEKYHVDRRLMAKNQPSVAPNGKIYASSKFLGNSMFEIGDVFSGIDAEKEQKLFEEGAILTGLCPECALKYRCNYAYDSWGLSPMQCAHEQLITPIADYVAETLYKERNALFIHKHYNEMYPFVSLVEDTSLG